VSPLPEQSVDVGVMNGVMTERVDLSVEAILLGLESLQCGGENIGGQCDLRHVN
jgi:hypothetical protein